MVVGFTLMSLIADSSLDWAVPYIDPAMVLITCAVFIPAPIRMVRVTIVELLEGAPSAEVQRPVLQAVGEVQALVRSRRTDGPHEQGRPEAVRRGRRCRRPRRDRRTGTPGTRGARRATGCAAVRHLVERRVRPASPLPTTISRPPIDVAE